MTNTIYPISVLEGFRPFNENLLPKVQATYSKFKTKRDYLSKKEFEAVLLNYLLTDLNLDWGISVINHAVIYKTRLNFNGSNYSVNLHTPVPKIEVVGFVMVYGYDFNGEYEEFRLSIKEYNTLELITFLSRQVNKYYEQ